MGERGREGRREGERGRGRRKAGGGEREGKKGGGRDRGRGGRMRKAERRVGIEEERRGEENGTILNDVTV